MAFCAETEEASVGFGFVNAKDVALRREAGGKIIARLPKDACVWVKDSKTDAKGVRWLRLNAALNEGANVDYTGWMKAEFVDTADEVWHDVVDVSCGSWGMIALKKDGTAETAGRPVADPVTDRWVQSRRWTDHFDKKIRQARSYVSSMMLPFSVLTGSGPCSPCRHRISRVPGREPRSVSGAKCRHWTLGRRASRHGHR